MSAEPRPPDVASCVVQIDGRLRALSAMNATSLRALRRDLSREVAGWDADMVVALACALVVRHQFEYRFLAYEVVHYHRAARRSLGVVETETLGAGMDNWASVDTFACYVAGPVWREVQIPDAVVHGWARAADRWWRRAALVSTVALNCKARGGGGDADRSLAVCRLLLHDRDDMVVKAQSWALRELAVRDPAAVEAFLHEAGLRLAPRAAREVRHKLTTGLKTPRRARSTDG